MAGGDSLVAHPRVCRPRCEVVCRIPGRPGQCTAGHQPLRESGRDAVPAAHRLHPGRPGLYQFLDAEGRVLYVGKAKSLRHRLPNYWQDSAKLPPRTAQMVAQADHVEWVVVDSEVDALILEHSLIQAHLPRYNVRLKDDKSYPWLAVTVNEEWPRPAVVRGRKRKGVRYFGPYGNAGAIRRTLDLLLRSFPVRTCSDTKFKRHAAPRPAVPALRHRPLLGPCVGAVDHEAYDGYVVDLMRFLSGDTEPVLAAPGGRDADGVRGAAVRAGGPAARPHRRGAQGGRDPADGVRPRRGLRRRRPGRGPAGGVGADLPRAPRPGGGPPRLRGREGGGPLGPRVHGAGRVSRSTARTAPRCRAASSCPSCRPTSTSSQSWLRSVREGPGRHRGAPARAPSGRSRRPSPASAGEDLARHRLRRASRPQRRSKALDRAADRARRCARRRCGSSATT